ncbi:uncharacterized protein TNCV_2763071 [Trichonephila clavipes]|nr:uncharacterized protein TNCV_2763071 [Trichonephila clavipes]
MQDHLWESCGSVVSPDDLCRSLICLHRLSGSSVFSSGREDLRCRRLRLVSCHLCDVITWWEQKLSALKIVIRSRFPTAKTNRSSRPRAEHRQGPCPSCMLLDYFPHQMTIYSVKLDGKCRFGDLHSAFLVHVCQNEVHEIHHDKGRMSVVTRSLEHPAGESTFWLVTTPILRENTLGQSGASYFYYPSTNLMRGLAVRRLFRVLPSHDGTKHWQ